MASAPPPAAAPIPTSDLGNATTRRGIAMAAFCLGFWSLAVFWWYPYSLFIAGFALVMGTLALVMGWKGGKDGEPFALYGIGFSLVTLQTVAIFYRGVQFFFEGTFSPLP
jgi:hypothetical protein